MGGLVLGWVKNEKMMGGAHHKFLPVCYYSRPSISNETRLNRPTPWSPLHKGLWVGHFRVDESDKVEATIQSV